MHVSEYIGSLVQFHQYSDDKMYIGVVIGFTLGYPPYVTEEGLSYIDMCHLGEAGADSAFAKIFVPEIDHVFYEYARHMLDHASEDVIRPIMCLC